MFDSTLHFDRLPGQLCRLLERLAGHYIEHCAGLERYGWVRHDGASFGRQELVDGGVQLTTSFVSPEALNPN